MEKPSDLDGVLYIEMGDAKDWQRGLANELHEAGLQIDMRAALAS